MPSDPVLGILALLFIWLLVRMMGSSDGEEAGEGRTSVKAKGLSGVRVVETLPDRPLAFAAEVTVEDEAQGKQYAVDLGELSCSCPEFARRRADLPPNAVGRVCDHVSEALRETGATGAFDPLLRTIVESGGTKEKYYEVELDSGETVAVGHTPGSDLLEIFARPRPKDRRGAAGPDRYRRYRYSPASDRWGGGERPPASGEIRDVVRKLPLKS